MQEDSFSSHNSQAFNNEKRASDLHLQQERESGGTLPQTGERFTASSPFTYGCHIRTLSERYWKQCTPLSPILRS